jgi:hypothetical protein
VVGLGELVLHRRGASTGVASGGGVLRVAMVASICDVFGQKKSISGISRVREGGQGQRGSSGDLWCCHNRRRTTAELQASGEELERPRDASEGEKERGKAEELHGLL